jgi:hypothetical protein
VRQYLRHVVGKILFVAPGFSELDKERSRPEEGIFVWKRKRVISYKDDMVRPEHKLKFQPNKPYHLATLLSSGWDFVNLSDPYVPQGAILNAEKHWQFGDMVLMKCRLEDYLDYREDALQRSERAGKARKDKFAAEAKLAGAVAISEDEIADMAGKEEKARRDMEARERERQRRLVGR